MKRNSIFLFFLLASLLFSLKVNSQSLVFTHVKSRFVFPLYSGGKFKVATKDNKKYKGLVQVIDVKTVIINDEKIGAITINVKDLRSFTLRRHIWYIAAWASLIKVNKTVIVEGAKAEFKPRIN